MYDSGCGGNQMSPLLPVRIPLAGSNELQGSILLREFLTALQALGHCYLGFFLGLPSHTGSSSWTPIVAAALRAYCLEELLVQGSCIAAQSHCHSWDAGG